MPTDDIDSGAIPTEALVADILEVFGLVGLIDWTDLGGGWTTNILITVSGRPVVARIHQGGRSQDRLLDEQAARSAPAMLASPRSVLFRHRTGAPSSGSHQSGWPSSSRSSSVTPG